MSLVSLAITGLLAGLLIGMNPVLISCFTSYISTMIGRKVNNARYTTAGILFIVYFVLFVLFFGLGFASFLSSIDVNTRLGVALAISIIGIGFSIMQIRPYFYNEPIIRPLKNVTDSINSFATKGRGAVNLIVLSLVVVYATLPTIGIAIALMSALGALIGPISLVWEIPFVLGLVTPIYIILALLSDGTRPSAIVAWKERSKPVMRLYGGLTILALSWLIMFIIAGGDISI